MIAELEHLVDAWERSVRSIHDLAMGLTGGQWERATECPGWSVRDVVSHIIGVELELLGDPRPVHTLPGDLPHVRDEYGRYREIPVDVRRCHTAPEMTGELSYVVGRRLRALRESTAGPDAEVRGLMGRSTPYRTLLRMRAFDVWVHEQDIRRAIGVPGGLDAPGALVARDVLVRALPDAVSRGGGLPAGVSVEFDVHGPVEFLRTVVVDTVGRGRLAEERVLVPTARIGVDWESYVRLTCGRARPSRLPIKTEGDLALAERVLGDLVVTR